MVDIVRKSVALGVSLAVAMPVLPVAAKTPGDVADLVGARGSSG
jgi:hypothetical protein